MGYYTTVTGEIIIDPPLNYREIKEWEENDQHNPNYWRSIRLVVNEEKVDTDQGLLISKSADSIVSTSEDQSKHYYIQENLQELVDLFGEKHSFFGYLEGHGEEAGDIWILRVHREKAVQTNAVVGYEIKENDADLYPFPTDLKEFHDRGLKVVRVR